MTGLGLVFLALFASAATSQVGGVYTAAVDTTTATAGVSTVFTFTITNDATSAADLGAVNITPPSGWTSIQAPGTATATGGKSWTALVQGGIVKLRAADDPNRLIPTEEVSIDVTATFCSAAAPNWSTDANEAIVTDFTGGDFALSGSEPPLQVDPGPAASLSLGAATTTPNAGGPNNLTITAKDGCTNTATSYTGTKDLTFGGASVALDGTKPTVSDNDGTARDFGQNTNIDFTSGVATVSGSDNGVMTLYKAEPASITVSDGSIDNGSGLAVTVAPGALDHFTWTQQPGASQTAGVNFPETIEVTAYDAYDNLKTNYDGDDAVFSGLGTSPNGDLPTYGFAWSGGVASSSAVVDKKAETTKLKVTDTPSTISGESSEFTVAPAALDSFKLSDSTDPNDAIDTQTAGSPFTVYATAFDEFGNIKTNYPGGGDTQTFSGLANSPLPSDTPPFYGAITWGSGTGQGSASITAFAAGSSLTITDTASGKTGTSTFTVLPGPLYRFRWTDEPNASQTAGVAFDSVAATAYDQWDNVKTNYVPAATFSGLSQSPRGCNADNTTVNPSGTFGCNPIYGFTWSSGVATSTTVKDYKAETTQLTVTDGSISASSDSGTPDTFTVAPNAANVPPTFFSEQPTLTERNTTINDTTGVKVTVLDQFGNPRSGDNVSVVIGTNPSGGTLTCPTSASPCTATTNGSGVATFFLRINNSGLGYTLTATAGLALTTSNGFDIANDVNPCSGTCTATGSTGTVSATTTASGLGSGGPLSSRLGPAAAAAPTDARLGMTVNQSVQVPTGVCGTGFQQLGDGFGVSTVQAGGNKPSFKVVATLDKAVVRLKPGNPGANKFDICLGAFNVNTPPPGPPGTDCSNATTSESWRTKNGTCAELNGGYYWGLVADYPSKVKDCPTAINSGLFPGVLSKMKTNAGDVVITFCVPYPWDEKGGFG